MMWPAQTLGWAESIEDRLGGCDTPYTVAASCVTTGTAERSVFEIVDVDDLAVLGEASAIMARLRDDAPATAVVGDAAGLGHAALQMLLDFVLLHPESVARPILR